MEKLFFVAWVMVIGGRAFGAPVRPIAQIVTGGFHTCALFEDHGVKCWGQNGSGELGLGDTMERGASVAQMGSHLPDVKISSPTNFRISI